jgi:hypothetical protein
MRTLRVLTALTLPLVLAVSAEAGKGDGKGKKGAHGFRGVVTAVKRDADKDAGTVTVKVRAKKGGTGDAPAEKTFKVTSATKFEAVSGAKGSRERKAATFADLKDGAHVVVRSTGDTASAVIIAPHRKKNG